MGPGFSYVRQLDTVGMLTTVAPQATVAKTNAPTLVSGDTESVDTNDVATVVQTTYLDSNAVRPAKAGEFSGRRDPPG